MGRSKDRTDSSGPWRRVTVCALGLTLVAGMASAEDDLLDMSLEELMNIEVTSVSKKAESKNDTAAAITVITAEDIRRGGFTSIPEALRIVPGVQVARIDASRWAISIRGFREEFSNKLLVMIDGRPVYTPLFGGVVWAEQNLAMQDVERIEVIRGPGGAIWGANAVNGVINIMTRHTRDTQGEMLAIHGGTQEYGWTARHGGSIGDDTTYRLTARGEKVEDYDFNQNYNGNDEYTNLRIGARSDTELDEDSALELHFDFWDLDYERGIGVRAGPPFFNVTNFSSQAQRTRGGAVQLTYDRVIDEKSHFEFMTFADLVDRRTVLDERSYNVQASTQYNRTLDEICDGLSMISGLDYRYWTTHTDVVTNTVVLQPNDDDLHLGSGFVQFELDLFDDMLTLIAGTKLSVNSWSGFEYQPSGRFVFRPLDGHVVWGAVSRAVRTPTSIDNDLNAFIGPVNLLGDRNFDSEELLSGELGYRFFALDWLTFESAAFVNDYESASALVGPPPVGPFTFSNPGSVQVVGLELEVTALPVEWWRLTANYTFLEFLRERDSDSPVGGGTLNRNQPEHQVTFRSVVDVLDNLEFDTSVYWVDGLGAVVPTLRSNNVRQYWRLDLRLGWEPVEWMEIALIGQNLNDARHAEYSDVQGNQSNQVPRSGYVMMTFQLDELY